VDDSRSTPPLSTPAADGEFATTIRERIAQARELLAHELAHDLVETDEIGVRAAQSRLAYLLGVAAEHQVSGTDVDHPLETTSNSMDELVR
jgi:hypothetical protein